jgi:hypothetical protein
MPTNLTYSIFEGLLVGFANRRMFHISALSGGGGGSTRHVPSSSVNNPYEEGLKTKGKANSPTHVHGGPIPPGRYTIEKPAHHAHLGLSARLVNPFRIHWEGMGSSFTDEERTGATDVSCRSTKLTSRISWMR